MNYIYIVPQQKSDGYCFGGPVPITFGNVDWFESTPGETMEQLVGFIAQKNYYRKAPPGTEFLVLGDHLTFRMRRQA